MASKEEWITILEQEDAEMVSIQVVEDIITSAQDVIFKKYLDQQILPYSLDFARNTLQDIIHVL